MPCKRKGDSMSENPLCPIHKRLDVIDQLQMPVGNSCLACSLNERTELIELLAPFAADDGSDAPIDTLLRLVEFYETHNGPERVVVSYPAKKDGQPKKL